MKQSIDDGQLMWHYFWFHCGNCTVAFLLFSSYTLIVDGIGFFLTPLGIPRIIFGTTALYTFLVWGGYHLSGGTLGQICLRLSRRSMFGLGAVSFSLIAINAYVCANLLPKALNIGPIFWIPMALLTLACTGPLLLIVFLRAIAHWPPRYEDESVASPDAS